MTAKEGADKVRRGEWTGYIPAGVWAELSLEDVAALIRRRSEYWDEQYQRLRAAPPERGPLIGLALVFFSGLLVLTGIVWLFILWGK